MLPIDFAPLPLVAPALATSSTITGHFRRRRGRGRRMHEPHDRREGAWQRHRGGNNGRDDWCRRLLLEIATEQKRQMAGLWVGKKRSSARGKASASYSLQISSLIRLAALCGVG
ncbi:hypothetical protein IWX92DRAFT_240322 [Phyllosticta citricarpa]